MKIPLAALAAFFSLLPLAQADTIYSIRGLATGTLVSQAFKGWVTVNLIPDAGAVLPDLPNYQPSYSTVPVTADLYTENPQSETQFLNQTATFETEGNFIVSVAWDGITLNAAALGYNPYWQSSTSGTPIALYIGSLALTQFSYGNLTVYSADPVATSLAPEPATLGITALAILTLACWARKSKSPAVITSTSGARIHQL